jgi:ABC-type transport system substrate-binding protein
MAKKAKKSERGDGTGDVKENVIGQNLSELRQASKLNQEIIANALGITPGTYSSWERGRTEPSAKDILRLASYFNVEVGRLFRLEHRPLKIGSWYPLIGKFHPIKNSGGFFSLIYPIVFSSLYHYDIHENRFYVGLIDSWSADNRNSTYTFYLKRDIKFHSGDPLGLEDVKHSYKLYIDQNEFYSDFIDNVVALENEYAIQLKLKRWLELEELPETFIIPKSYIETEREECFDGTGPFKLTDVKQQDRIRDGLKEPVTLESNNAYLGKVASIRSVEYKFIKEPRNLEDSLDKGEIDLAYAIEPKSLDTNRFVIKRGEGAYVLYLVLTQSSKVCEDNNIRKAIDLALDREAIINALKIDNTQLLPNFHLYLVLRDVPYEYSKKNDNDAEIKALLDKVADSLRKSDGTEPILRVSSSYREEIPFMSELIGEIINQLTKIGIKTQYEPEWQKADALVQIVEFPNIEMIYMNLHSQGKQGSVDIPWKYKNSYIDQLLENFNGMETYRQVQNILTAEKVFLPLFRMGVTVAYTKDLFTNYKLRVTSAPYSDIAYWEFKS